MTEAEWLECTDPTLMLDLLRGKASDRKLRLFAVACCWRIWPLVESQFRRVVEILERYSDGQANAEEVRAARNAASGPGDGSYGDVFTDAETFCFDAADAAMRTAVSTTWKAASANTPDSENPEVYRVWVEAQNAEASEQCPLIRDIFGNPFRTVAVELSWMAWNNGTVVKMAQGVYDERTFDRLPVLAEALEEAGCHDAEILGHCRQPGEHVRGCWVVDLLLGKW